MRSSGVNNNFVTGESLGREFSNAKLSDSISLLKKFTSRVDGFICIYLKVITSDIKVLLNYLLLSYIIRYYPLREVA